MLRLALAWLVLVAPLDAQVPLTIRVVDSLGHPVPYAVVDASPGGRRVADSDGVVAFTRLASVDSTLIIVRRVGYGQATVRVAAGVDSIVVGLSALARALATVEISERRNTPLARRGFYDRMERVQHGAIVGEFITPEDLDRLGAMTVARALTGARYVQVTRSGSRQRPVLLGRGGCGYTILVDGVRAAGTLEEGMHGATSIDGRATTSRQTGMAPLDVEEIVNGGAIAAVEVYPSTANAPAELQAAAMGGRGSCGIIAFWTGARR